MEPTNLSIKNWAEDDKPREKLMLKGKTALSDAELIAILLGSGSRNESAVALSQRILFSANNSLVELGRRSIEQLCKFKGIGEAKAITIIAAAELARRRKSEDVVEIQKITSSKDVFDIMQPIIGELLYEEFWLICLNNSSKILHKSQISKGGISQTTVDIRIVFKIAFEQNATAIVLVHNHPSGRTTPSNADIEITEKIVLAGTQLDIPLVDHVIVAENDFQSILAYIEVKKQQQKLENEGQ